MIQSAAPAPRRKGIPLNFGHHAPTNDRSTIASDDDDDGECRACEGQGVDRFGFDCTTCFGTGKIENDE